MIITKRKILTVLCFLIIAAQQIFIGYLMLRDDGEKRYGIFIPIKQEQPQLLISSYRFFYRGATTRVYFWTARNNSGKEVLHIEPPFECWEMNKRIK